MNFIAQPLIKDRLILGEGAFWDSKTSTLYYLDILGQKVFAYNPKTIELRSFLIGQDVGSVVISNKNTLILAVKNGFLELDPVSLSKKFLSKLDKDNNIRFNDGKCDPAGRFWAGTMRYDETKDGGSLYYLNAQLILTKVIDKVSISNGIVWTADKKKMYYIDSATHKVTSFNYDIKSGEISGPETVIEINKELGVPDGMAIDTNGNLWIALYDGGGVGCWSPENGQQLSFVSVPNANLVTSCAFGGENLQELYITTASVGLNKRSLSQQFNAGYLFKVKLPVKGVASTRFKF